MIQTDRVIEHRRPDIVVAEKIGGKCFIIDIAVPGDHNVQLKELERKQSMKISGLRQQDYGMRKFR